MTRIAVVDYCKGNLKSVERGLRFVGADAFITDNPAEIEAADAVVLPGVGAFADAAAQMVATGQMDCLRRGLEADKPFLGICLGLHLMFAQGTEGVPGQDASSVPTAEGLGSIPGVVDRLPRTDSVGNTYKIPHVGWNSVDDLQSSRPLFQGIPEGTHFYFTHSFIAPANHYTVASTTHSITFPSAVAKANAFGVQFHPEKSSDAGMQVLENFLSVARA